MRNKLTKFLTSECPPKGMRQFAKTWKYAACMLLAFFLGIGNVWGACPDAGTIYKFVVKTGLTNNSNITEQDITITTSNYLSEFTGSTGAALNAYNKDKKFQIADQSCFKLTDGSKSYLILNLGECTLRAGDIVKTIITSQNTYLYTSTSKDDTNKALITKSSNKTTYNTLVITDEMDVVGASTLYLYNASNGPQIYSFEIIRPYTITLDAATNGGTVSTTSIKGAEGDKVVLPHAFKSGYKFKGWYTAASGGTKQANLYTVSGNATFVAQFEELPTSGEMFSLSMETDLKPAANCTLKSATGFATQVDMLTYATIEGGAAFFKNTSSNNHAIITSAGAFNFAGSNAVMEIPLDFALQNGDEIQTDFSNKVWLSAATTKPSSGPYVDGSNKTYTIIESDGLKNATTLYLYTGASGATATSIVITRPAPKESHTLSYVVDPTDKATVTLSATSVEEEGTATATYSAIDPAYEFDEWQISGTDATIDDAKANPVTITMGTDNAVVTLKLKPATTKYAVTKGTHINGDFTITPAEQEENGIVTLIATPSTDYMFSAWEVVKTSDGTSAGVTVTNNKFTMPGFAVTVNATFVADTRKKVLYVTSTAEAIVKENDKLYDALKDIYNVSIVGPASDADQTNYDLVVLHESIGGSNYNAAAVAAAKTGSTPVLNTKSYFYNDGRFGWGTPNAGTSVKGATQNSAYCNIASHPLFDGLTVTDGFFEITDDAAAKCMQPIGEFTSGKEGYTLATTPNNGGGNGCAIHELTPAQRDASAGKYLMISVSNSKLDALNANGQKLFQNAAAYLIDGTASWTPVAVPTSPVVAATPTENYIEGGTITLTASAEGTSASTVYTWYKGADWATASATTPVQAASTSGATFSKTAAVEDAGTYWCNISNGTSCDAQASVTITVSSASTPTHTISYDNVKDADMTAYPTEYTEGIGVASFDPLADITGWHFVEWSPASIATDATTDQTITAVWAQVFEVTFNLQGHGAEIAKQDIISGEKATEPTAPSAIGYDFGGWYTDEECTAGNEFDFNTPITAATPLYAKWTAFDGCAMLYPATSGTGSGEEGALAVDDVIAMQTGSFGGTMKITNLGSGAMSYTSSGLAFASKSGPTVSVVLNNEMSAVAGTQIQITLVAGGEKTRGLTLKKANGDNISAFTCWVEGTNDASNGAEETFTYIVQEGDGLDGTNEFQLARNNTVYLKSLKVINCGDAIVYHNVTSAVNPAGKGTVTLGASTVREGSTTTAEYSAIDPLYEFVNWTVSGAGASVADATANPATITVGTEDAVVTLNLRLIPVKFTVEYYDGATLMGSEQVAVTENPTASEIVTAKRHYTFLGWSDTDGGDVVALNTITRTEAGTVKLYAKYEAVVCPTSGTIFSMESDEAKKPASTVTIAKDASIDLAEYATISGGNAMIINGETSGKDAISTDGEFLLKATKEVMKIELNCVLQEGDIIRIPDNSAKLVISTSNSKTGTYQAFADKNTHEFAVTAAWAGVDDIYVLYDGSSLKFTKVYVIRPAKFDVSFNLMGHGSAIADLEDVVDGSKIAAPSPAPTDVDYSFAGWYKENTLENEWDFDVDVVTDNITLYAKWLDKSDATLKSLKYGETEITLEAGVYTYNVSLPAFTSAVPALTAETSSPNATKVITNGTFDGEGNATSTVTVTPEVGADQIYTVNFAKGVEILLQDVTGSTTWNFANAVTETVNITGTPHVLANYGGVTNDATFESNKLEASGEKFTAGTKANLRANYIHFHTTVQGMLTISYSNTGGSNPARFIYVNGVKYDEEGSANTTAKGADRKVFVPAGDVELVMKDGEGASKNVQIYQIIFKAPDYVRTEMLGNGVYGTICVDHNVPEGGVRGVTVYKIAGREPQYGKIAFDEVTEMEAGVPYVFIAHGNEMALYYGETKVDNPVDKHNGMYGTFTAQTLTDLDGIYYFAKSALWSCVDLTSLNLPANRAYVKLSEIDYLSDPNPAPGRKRILLGVNGQNAATDLGNVQGDEVQSTKVLINGQLFILRGEKMYDATGRMVK